MRTLGAPLDFNKNQALNMRLHVSGSAPTSPVTGQIYFDSGTNAPFVWDGTQWSNLFTASFTGGAGLTLTGTTFDVNVDSSSIEINADTLRVKAAGITNAMLAGGIAYSKLSLTGAILNADLAGGIAYSKLSLTGAILNADLAGGIALSKLATDPLARANHTGTQLAATISDFDTQVRTSRIDQLAAAGADVSLGTHKLTNLADGTANTDGATWGQVQTLVSGLRKSSVAAATTGNIALTGTQTIDTRAVIAGERVLVKNQTAPAENGIYVVAAGAWARATDADTAGELDGAFVIVEDGAQAGTAWVTTSEVTTLGTDSITWTQFNKATDIVGGAGLTMTGLTLDVNVDSSSIEINADTLRVKAGGITNAMLAGSIAYGKLSLTGAILNADLAGGIDLTSKVTGALPVGNGGTGQTTAKAGRETGLGAAGYYSSATHGSILAGGTLVITQATHLLRASKGLSVTTTDEASGDQRLDDVNVAASGDVTITYTQAQSANSIRVTVVG